MPRVAMVTVARSDFGIQRRLAELLRDDPDMEFQLYIGGSHLSPTHGQTIREIEAAGFSTAHQAPSMPADDSPMACARAMAEAMAAFAKLYTSQKPDLLLLLGDRFEMLAAAVAAVPFGITMAHIHGGEVTLGAMDDTFRNAITRISHLHFPATQAAADRLVTMGELLETITVSGAPALDTLSGFAPWRRQRLGQEVGLDLDRPFLLITAHPATRNPRGPKAEIDAILNALEGSSLRLLFTGTNTDPGSQAITDRISTWVAGRPNAVLVPHLGQQGYFSAMHHAAAMVGNSSSGLIEAPSLALPVVNVGPRQDGRLRGANVIDAQCDPAAVRSAVQKALSPAFRDGLSGQHNPYGDGRASPRIHSVLRHRLLQQVPNRTSAPLGVRA